MIARVGIWLGGEELTEGSCHPAQLMFIFIGQLLGEKKEVLWISEL